MEQGSGSAGRADVSVYLDRVHVTVAGEIWLGPNANSLEVHV